MKVELRRYFTLIAETDKDRAALEALNGRIDEVRVEHGNHMFRDQEITIYLPTRQPVRAGPVDRPLEHQVDPKASARPRRSDLPILEAKMFQRTAIAYEMMRLIKEDDRRSD